jgi:hypothetical protein
VFAGRGVGPVQLVDPQRDGILADANEVGGAVAVHVGELPAVGLRHRRDPGHVGRVLEEAEAGARGDEDALLGLHDAHEVREAVAVHVRELHARVAEAQAGGRRRDGLGRVKPRGVPPLQQGPGVPIVVAEDVDPAVEVEIDEGHAGVGEVEADVDRQGRGGFVGGRAAAEEHEPVALPRPVQEILDAVAGQVGEARGGPDRGGGRVLQVLPGGERLAAEVSPMTPGAGLTLEQVGERVTVDVDPRPARGGRVERGGVRELEALQRVAGRGVFEAQGRERGPVGGDGDDLGRAGCWGPRAFARSEAAWCARAPRRPRSGWRPGGGRARCESRGRA